MSDHQAQPTTHHDGGVPHPYHLVSPSFLPLAGALAAGLLSCGALLYMADVRAGEEGRLWLLGLGAATVVLVMFLWWWSVVRESIKERAHTAVVKLGLRYSMALFIMSEVMFFVAFFWAFFGASLYPQIVDGSLFAAPWSAALNPEGIWPPPAIEVIDALGLPLLMTVILLLSGVTVTWAHHAILEGDRDSAEQGLGLTILLGVMFLFFMVYEYNHAEFGFREGIYPTTFFMATGFHGFHVFVGVIFLTVCLFRMMKGHFTASQHFGFEAAAWYWHFVDVVWLFLFVAIYWWGALPT